MQDRCSENNRRLVIVVWPDDLAGLSTPSFWGHKNTQMSYRYLLDLVTLSEDSIISNVMEKYKRLITPELA